MIAAGETETDLMVERSRPRRARFRARPVRAILAEDDADLRAHRGRGQCEHEVHFVQRRARRLPSGRHFIFVDDFGTDLSLSPSGIVAPFALVGAQNGHAFEAYLRTPLAPHLRSGDVVLVDGLGAHRSDGARAAVERQGAST